ncbi:unnamed protein product, partial [Ectocarpus fasciculatus]
MSLPARSLSPDAARPEAAAIDFLRSSTVALSRSSEIEPLYCPTMRSAILAGYQQVLCALVCVCPTAAAAAAAFSRDLAAGRGQGSRTGSTAKFNGADVAGEIFAHPRREEQYRHTGNVQVLCSWVVLKCPAKQESRASSIARQHDACKRKHTQISN